MVSAYGSFYRLGDDRAEAVPFEHVLASAVALGAPTIRVWAGGKGSADCSPDERQRVVSDAQRVAKMAARSGITISLKYHGGTLTDTRASVQALMGQLTHPNIEFLWQPTNGEEVESNVVRLLEVLPRLRNVHVFHWWPTAAERHPLAAGADRRQIYLDIVRETGRDIDCLLEFVAGDSPEQFMADATTLRQIIRR